MNEDVEFLIETAKESMESALDHLGKELGRLRAGKASVSMLDGVMVNNYGVNTPLNQVSNLSAPDPRTITIQPWDKNMIEPIEKAIMAANLGFNPANNGEIIRINVPILTEERRKQLVKQVKSIGEDTKISIRNSRRETNDEIKTLKKEGLSEDEAKNAEDDVQKLTDKFIENVDELIENKEKEIMTV